MLTVWAVLERGIMCSNITLRLTSQQDYNVLHPPSYPETFLLFLRRRWPSDL